MGDEEQGFVIRDKRGRGEEKPAVSAPESPPPSSATSDTAAPLGSQASSPGEGAAPPLSFSSFIFSLGTSSLMLMGEQLDPSQPKTQVNLPQAKEIIDILSILEEKTRGNLTSEEEGVMKELLYALRMKYVDLTSGKSGTPSS